MTRLEALTALKEALEAGGNPSQSEWHEVFPDTPDDDDYPRSMMAVQAAVGWIDAARALHEAVLQAHQWCISHEAGGDGHVCNIFDCEADASAATTHNTCPARAWLIAILSALIAQETCPMTQPTQEQITALEYDAQTLILLLDEPDPSEQTWLENNAKASATLKRMIAMLEALAAERDALKAELADGSFYQEKDIDAMIARADAAEAEVARLRAALRIMGINPDSLLKEDKP